MGCRFRFLLLYILQYDSAAYQPYQNNLAATLYLISISFQYINSVHNAGLSLCTFTIQSMLQLTNNLLMQVTALVSKHSYKLKEKEKQQFHAISYIGFFNTKYINSAIAAANTRI